MALDAVAQQLDFSLGMFRSGALEREPDGAAEQIVGLLGADGLPYRRGGSVYKSNAAVGAAGLLWLWDGWLAGGRRTVFGAASDTALLGVDDATPSSLGFVKSAPVRPVAVGGMVMLPTSSSGAEWRLYAGSRKASNYSTGTVSWTGGSGTVTGAGTSWLANVDVGMVMVFNTGTPGIFYTPPGIVREVVSDTHIELVEPWVENFPVPTPPGDTTVRNYVAFGYTLYRAAPITLPFNVLPIAASVAGRFVAVDNVAQNVLRFSPQQDPMSLSIDDFYSFPGTIRGLGVLRDVLLVFTTAGVYAISGMAYPLVDPGSGDPLQRDELVNQDLICWGHEGIASWSGSLVVPALDNVYLMDSLGAPTPIGGRILDLYLSYVQAGYAPGVAEVYNGHYFLPILNPASSYAWVDTLVCRLQPSNSGNTFAWAQLDGSGAEVAAFAERQTVPPLLLGASRRTTSRVLDDSGFFKPSAAVKNDADATTPRCTLTTVDYPTGNMVSNFVHHVRLMYELVDAAADDPTLSAEVSVDGGAFTALSGVAGEGSPAVAKWRVNKYARNVRFRFVINAPSASFKIKSVEVFVRHAGRQ